MSTEDELFGKQVLANETHNETVLVLEIRFSIRFTNHHEFFCVLVEFVVIRKVNVLPMFVLRQEVVYREAYGKQRKLSFNTLMLTRQTIHVCPV